MESSKPNGLTGSDNRSGPVKSKRRDDLLKNELAHRRITLAAFRLGRRLQDHFEAASLARYPPPWPKGPRVDCSQRQADPCADIRRARARVGFEQWVEGAVGRDGLRDLKALLADGLTFAEYATQNRKAGERGIREVANRFRQLLKLLEERWAAPRACPVVGKQVNRSRSVKKPDPCK